MLIRRLCACPHREHFQVLHKRISNMLSFSDTITYLCVLFLTTALLPCCLLSLLQLLHLGRLKQDWFTVSEGGEDMQLESRVVLLPVMRGCGHPAAVRPSAALHPTPQAAFIRILLGPPLDVGTARDGMVPGTQRDIS